MPPEGAVRSSGRYKEQEIQSAQPKRKGKGIQGYDLLEEKFHRVAERSCRWNSWR